ncbi:MAG: hypothetical protein ABI851_02680 [Saprospiraceae bacterium]
MKILIAIISFYIYHNDKLFAQDIPITNIYCAHISNPKDGKWIVNKLDLLNSFNYNHYNNQPHFISDNELLCTVRTAKDKNTDILRLNLSKQTYKYFIDNDGSDFSPRVRDNVPSEINCVHIDAKDTVQNLVSYSSKDGSYVKTIFNHIGQIGYYRHHKDNNWICFLVDKPNNLLSICNSASGERKIFASNIGRTFESDHKQTVFFVHKILNDQWILKSYDITTQSMTVIAKMPVYSEDFLFDSSGRIICSSDSKIMLLNKETKLWEVLCDFQELGIKNIGRIELRNNLLVFVNEVK